MRGGRNKTKSKSNLESWYPISRGRYSKYNIQDGNDQRPSRVFSKRIPIITQSHHGRFTKTAASQSLPKPILFFRGASAFIVVHPTYLAALTGFLPTMSHMGVKQPVAPPPAQPMPPAWSITWVCLVPDGTRRISSKNARILGIKKYMTGLN